jgi:ABC transport system ATP-binding/permease protein
VKVKQIPTNDPIWQHSKHIFFFDMAMLAALSLLYGGYVRWRIRLKR